jgi:hypothetical protein
MKYKLGEINFLMCAVVVGVVLIIGVLIHLMVQEEREWREFSSVNRCHIVGKVQGDIGVAPVIGDKNGGVAIVSTDDKTGYLCDDGVTYWRND